MGPTLRPEILSHKLSWTAPTYGGGEQLILLELSHILFVFLSLHIWSQPAPADQGFTEYLPADKRSAVTLVQMEGFTPQQGYWVYSNEPTCTRHPEATLSDRTAAMSAWVRYPMRWPLAFRTQ
jgi:hypothetical protein